MEAPVLFAQEIRKAFSGVQALDTVSLSIRSGEVVALIGENGSGKSTLIKIIAGVLSPDSGRIFLNGRSMDRLDPIQAIRQGIQVIYQDFSLFPNLTVAENIALNTELASGRRLVRPRRFAEIARIALNTLEVQLDLDARVERLPVAEQQLVAICRALVQGSRLIVMDEPTAALTRKEIVSLYRVIENLQRHSIAVLFVSHKLEEIQEISSRVCVLRGGRVAFEGALGESDTALLAFSMTGRKFDKRTSETRTTGSRGLLAVEELGRGDLYDEVSFVLHGGEVLGITGLLGSGQSELALGLFGLLPHERGRLLLEGEPLRVQNPGDAVAAGFGFVPGDRLNQGLFLDHSVWQNLTASCLGRFRNRLGLLDVNGLLTEAQRWAGDLKISTGSLEAAVNTLSGGNQQRVVIARWLAVGPRVLILENPTSGVDVGSKYDLHGLIRDLASRGTSILIISDDLREVVETCDRLLIMKRGRIVRQFLAGEIDEDALVNLLLE